MMMMSLYLNIILFRVLAAEDRAQCAGRGLDPGPCGPAGCQTRLHRASGLYPGDDDDMMMIMMMIMMLMLGSTQDRRRGNPAWSWTHNHKEYPTGQFLPHLTLSCFCLLFLAKILENIKYPRLATITDFPPREGCVERTNWRVFVFCIYGP